MVRLDFDFHARPARYSKPGVALLVAGVGALIWSVATWQQARATETGQALRLAAYERTPVAADRRPASRAEDAALKSQTDIAAQLRFSWQPAFAALDNTHTPDIALVSLDANQAKAQLKLVAEARQLSDAIAFLNALQQQPGVARAELLQHELQKDAAQKPVRFTVLVELQGPARRQPS